MANKLFHVHDNLSNRNWIVLAKNYDEAEKKVEEEFTDYFPDNVYDFETEVSENGGVEISTIKVEVL